MICGGCNSSMHLKKYKWIGARMSWRNTTNTCIKYQNRKIIRRNSFFDKLTIYFFKIMKILIRWSLNVPQRITLESLNINDKTYKKIIKKVLERIDRFDFRQYKLGSVYMIVQVVETQLNFQVKSNGGMVSTNKTDAIVL
ncbi:hypothetical protein DMUE_3289 [Dictyocoela muelleri]|nr:hypothetical protein DMUE_3289 [Dictyocoela muelleri]